MRLEEAALYQRLHAMDQLVSDEASNSHSYVVSIAARTGSCVYGKAGGGEVRASRTAVVCSGVVANLELGELSEVLFSFAPLSFPLLPSFEVSPLSLARRLGTAVSSPSGV